MSRFLSVAVAAAMMCSLCQAASVQARIAGPIDERQLTTLRGNTHPLAQAGYDLGPAPASLPMERMLLVLTPSAEQRTALETLLEKQQDKTSPQFHRWFTPAQFGQQFGASQKDLQMITGWLQFHGFEVSNVSNGRNVIEFSGTAGQVAQAFHTSIHKYAVNGIEHWANATDPQIPSALAPLLAGVATLHNFSKHSQIIRSNLQFEGNSQAGSRPQLTATNGAHALSPADYAVIYDFTSQLANGIDGSGTSIAVVGRSNINVQNIVNFRKIFGLSNNPPAVVLNGADPGDLGGDEEAEAVLDTTWSGAVAPGASVKLVVSKTTNTTDGVDLSEEYIIDNNVADIMTESFGDCEADYTQAEAAFYTALAQQAAAQGISYFVAAGDSGAEGCDAPTETSATGPLSVNLLSSNPYVTAVGGTEFDEGGADNLYWSGSNFSNGQSAISYIPENAWNESCTPAQCGSNAGLWSGGGGVSMLYPRPSWQTGVTGIPNDSSRHVPDVSLSAAGHDPYLLCVGANACTPNSTGHISLSGYSGTSAATPSFAGIMALVDQVAGVRQGNANYVLYALAANPNTGFCDILVSPHAYGCIFNDVIFGNNAVPGEQSYGTSSPLYPAGMGYDMATGLGSVDVANLVNQWVQAEDQVPHIRLDTDVPGPLYPVLIGSVTFSGWAIDDVGAISKVTLAIDGVPLGQATYGTSRADVCNNFPGRIGCPNVGWYFPYDTTLLANGQHNLDVTATSDSARNYTISTLLTVANWVQGGNPVMVNIDTPNAQSGALSGMAQITGWALDYYSRIIDLEAAVDNVPFKHVTYGANRPDLCNTYPIAPDCPNVGWTASLDTTRLADGPHVLDISVTPRYGEPTVTTTTFTVANLTPSNPIKTVIDFPAAQSLPLSGSVVFSGWALDKNTPINAVKVNVDGVYFAGATYGNTRPDVCNSQSGIPGCPNVGWTASIDTTQIPNGSHTVGIQVVATDGLRSVVARGFTVSNTPQDDSLQVKIDQPITGSTVLGVTTFSGFVYDTVAIPSVSILIDGFTFWQPVFGIARPDVCTAQSGIPGCPNVGWSLTIDTNLLANGPHTIEVAASGPVGSIMSHILEYVTVSSTFSVANWTTDPTHMYIDFPGSNSLVSGVIDVSGWAFDQNTTITGVTVAVDGVPFGAAVYGNARPDVCGHYGNPPGCPNVGWELSGFDTTLIADGRHTMDITATTSAGTHNTITGILEVANASRINIAIDRPAANQTLSGQTTIGGWAIDSASPITSVVVEVDGVEVGAAIYGTSRQDVCNHYPGTPGCPDVGWTLFNFDTTLLANGAHTLDVRAVAANGEQATASSRFQVTN